jgi:signal transduction histidine kinase
VTPDERAPGATVDTMTEQPHPDGVRLLPWSIPDWLIDTLLVLVVIVGAILRPIIDNYSFEVAEAFAAAAAIVLLLTRRRYPLPTLAVAVALSAITIAITERPPVLLIVALITLFTVAQRSPRRTAIIAGALTTAAFLLMITALLRRGAIDGAGLAAIAWPAFATAAGTAVRSTRENVAAAQERAQRAERSQELEAERRVIEERLRIARDVHDLVAHHIAVINVQSGVAEHLIDSNPAAATESIGIVRHSASTVVDQLGELLGVLRSADDASDPTAPTPDLAAVDDLISSFAASGLVIADERSGTPRPLSGSAELAAYRVVQEALTNAHKYGDGTASVALRFDDHGLDIVVSNPTDRAADGAAASGNGFGLIGMRERVEAVGGTITAGTSVDDRRFEIVASIPQKDLP